MPYSKKKPAMKKRRAGGRRRAARPMRSVTGVPEWASASFTRALINPNPPPGQNVSLFNPNTMYRFYDLAIDQFPRAIPIASAYQQYRIKRVTLRIRPLVDTFTAGMGQTVPQFYYQIDKNKSLSNFVAIAQLKQMGCVPRRLDDKNLSVTYAPGVLDAANDDAVGGLTFAKTNISPWLNTTDDPFAFPVAVSSVDHLGVVWTVEQLVGDTGIYTVDCTIDVQYRKPAWDVSPDPPGGRQAALNVA